MKPRSKAVTRRASTAATRAHYDGEAKVVLAQGAAQAALVIVQTIQVLVEGHEYRARLGAMVKALETDQGMRHADVDYLVDVLDRFRGDMTPQTRDQYFMSILKLLDVTGLRARLPSLGE
jgi:hypothetical protein